MRENISQLILDNRTDGEIFAMLEKTLRSINKRIAEGIDKQNLAHATAVFTELLIVQDIISGMKERATGKNIPTVL